MPLNSNPPTVSESALLQEFSAISSKDYWLVERKVEPIENQCHVFCKLLTFFIAIDPDPDPDPFI
eukprot:Pgem_evm1s11916